MYEKRAERASFAEKGVLRRSFLGILCATFLTGAKENGPQFENFCERREAISNSELEMMARGGYGRFYLINPTVSYPTTRLGLLHWDDLEKVELGVLHTLHACNIRDQNRRRILLSIIDAIATSREVLRRPRDTNDAVRLGLNITRLNANEVEIMQILDNTRRRALNAGMSVDEAELHAISTANIELRLRGIFYEE